MINPLLEHITTKIANTLLERQSSGGPEQQFDASPGQSTYGPPLPIKVIPGSPAYQAMQDQYGPDTGILIQGEDGTTIYKDGSLYQAQEGTWTPGVFEPGTLKPGPALTPNYPWWDPRRYLPWDWQP